MLVEDNEISGIIDWSGGAFGDPRYDIALATQPKPEAFNTEEDIRVFFEGYGHQPLSDDEVSYFVGLYEFF